MPRPSSNLHNAAMFYTNETIVLSRTGQTDATIAAADKAIAADPNKADSLLPEGTSAYLQGHRRPQDAEDRRTPGYRGSLQQVSRARSQGPMAPEAKSVLAEIGEKINTKYSKH